MKAFVAALVVALVATVWTATPVRAADHSSRSEAVSADTLAQMGLGGMQSISDEQGHRIRGEGYIRFRAFNFALVWSKPIEVRQVILIGSKTSPANAIAVSFQWFSVK